MSSWPLVKYVDAPTVTATVRYDFNDQAGTPAKKVTEFDPGVPTLEGDPDAVGQQWGFRSPSITHTIKGSKAQAMAALSLVSREQLRRTNWVMFQPSAGVQPVWFKTYRTGYQPITLDQVYVKVAGGGTAPLPDTWKITVPLVAEAFTYGARVNIPTVQIVQSPADLAGPKYAMRYILPAIKGDAPTPLRIAITPAEGSQYVDFGWLLGCISGETTMSDPVVGIGTGDGFTAGTNTGAGVANAAYFGGSYRLASVTASDLTAGSNFSVRLTGSFSSVPPGRYKIAARCELDTASGSKDFIFALGIGTGTGFYSYGNSVVARAGSPGSGIASTRQGWVDLGDFTLPFALTAPTDVTGTTPAAPFSLKVGTPDNSAGTVRLDSFKLIPVDGRTVTSCRLLSSVGDQGPGIAATNVGTFDGDAEMYWQKDSGGTFIPITRLMRGAFPVADPAAAQNLLILMVTTGGSVGSAAGGTAYLSSIDSQAAVDVSYYPRYLHVGDGT